MKAIRVWVIDASRITRKILEVSLGRAGFADPVEALQVLQRLRDGLPNVAYIAAGLPRMDGYKVIHGLHNSARYDQIKLIGLLTEEDGMLGRLKIRLAGARQYLVKPLRTQEVLSMLSALLEKDQPGEDS